MMEGGIRTRGILKSSEFDFPLISIITVVFNRKIYLEQTILSVLNQTYKNIEYIIIDGGSTDGSLDVIKKYDNLIDYWISEPDNGMYFAINKGIELSGGDFIGICHSDDYYFNNNVLKELSDFVLNEEADVFHGDMIPLLEDKTLGTCIVSNAENIGRTNNGIIHPSTFIKKELFRTFGLYNTAFRSASDYELMMRLWVGGCKFKHLGIIVSVIRVAEANRVSNNCFGLLEDYKIHRIYKTGYSLKFLMKYLYCIIHTISKRFGLPRNSITRMLKRVLRNFLVKE